MSSIPSAAPGHRDSFGLCYVAMEADEIIIGNEWIERRWQIKNGLLYATSLRDLTTGREWLARAATQPAPCPELALPDEPREVQLTSRSGTFSPTEDCSLIAELTVVGATVNLVYQFQVFPAARGIVLQLSTTRVESKVESDEDQPSDDDSSGEEADLAPTGIEEAPSSKPDDPLPSLDDLEHLELAPPHLRLTQVTLWDQTDVHNELVFETEWLLHPNEGNFGVAGNLFIIEDTLTHDGLIFLKHAPLPHARPHPVEHDFRVHCKSVPHYRCAFYGQGRGDEDGAGYRFVTLAYTGGHTGRIEALQTYQRQLRTYQPQRDGLFLSNTWGDRSRDGRINEPFMRQELEAGARLGVDVVQIDDGWQRGRTSNSVESGGVWQGFWAADPNFWDFHPQRFPAGLAPIIDAARKQNLQFGLWFAPDSAYDFANWHLDAAKVLELHRSLGINYFKIDGVKAKTRTGERHLRHFFEEVMRESQGRVTFDLDVTAEIRPGYFGAPEAGPLFVENRYTDWHGYWPHQTLRNLWKLAHYVDPLRLRMEFLNNSRNTHLYENDPLAPACYRPAYLFATTMFANPLGWFETSNLPESYFQEIAPLVRIWKMHREQLFGGRIIPIGDAPNGTSWTGFVSIGADRRSGYLLIFRELNDRPRWSLELPMFSGGSWHSTVLAGRGSLILVEGRLTVEVPRAQDFVFAQAKAG
ncbi:MAG: alpha-galactosidase [Armatimonadota bacterium]|nr:alpha-galactosidase [Armatimonadota bacterium]